MKMDFQPKDVICLIMKKFLAKIASTFLRLEKIESDLILKKIIRSGTGFQVLIKRLLLFSALSTALAMPTTTTLGGRAFMSVPDLKSCVKENISAHNGEGSRILTVKGEYERRRGLLRQELL